MSVLQPVQTTEWPLYRRSMVALADAMGRGPAYLGGDNLALIVLSLLVSLCAALRARLGRDARSADCALQELPRGRTRFLFRRAFREMTANSLGPARRHTHLL